MDEMTDKMTNKIPEEMTEKIDKELENIDEEIEQIDKRINSLMEIKDEELTPAERMGFGIKLMNQKTRLMMLKRTSELRMPEGREKALSLAMWMKQLRGESIDG